MLRVFITVLGLGLWAVPLAQAFECYVDPIYERNWCGRYKIAAYVLERECSGTPKLETVAAGTVLPIIAETDGWYKVKTNKGNIGWTGATLIEVVDCSLLTPASTTTSSTSSTTTTTVTTTKSGAFNLLEHVKGRMLLAVEDHGKIWYVSPVTGKRYQATVDNALPLFRSLALGITNADLNKLPLYGGVQHHYNMELRNRLKGRLLLAVEDHGRVWYVGKDDTWRREVTKENIMDVFREHSLGISNVDLEKIQIGDVNTSEVASNPAPTTSAVSTSKDSEVITYDLPDSGVSAPSDWQNYTGNGFNFFYPSTWFSGTKNIYPNWKYFSEEADYIANLNTPNYLDVDSYVLAYKVGTSVSATLSDAEALKKGGYYLSGYNIIETDVFIINGVPALRELLYAPRGTTVNGSRVTSENEYIILYTYRSGTTLYRLQYFSAHWQDRYNFDLFDKMAKTFKLN